MGSSGLGRVLADLELPCLDIGARRGFTADLLPLAFAVDAIGFEPDAEECRRLEQEGAAPSSPWRSLRYLPVALAREEGRRRLYLYRNRDCSSFLEANQALAASFGRGGYFDLDGTIDVPTMPLDRAAAIYGFADAVFLKLDVQGTELEILESGPTLLERSLLVVRTEVEFVPLYRRQPLFADVDRCLRACGFLTIGFLESHCWQLPAPRGETSKQRSRAQLVHADALYFRDPQTIPEDPPRSTQALVKLACLAACYGYVDFAGAILRRPVVATYLRDAYDVDASTAVAEIGRTVNRRQRRRELGRIWSVIKGLGKEALSVARRR
jgi:FkbM family methyltransferase